MKYAKEYKYIHTLIDGTSYIKFRFNFLCSTDITAKSMQIFKFYYSSQIWRIDVNYGIDDYLIV